MKEQRLGTRNLADTSETDFSDSQAAGEELGSDQKALTGQAGDSAIGRQMAAEVEPVSRNRGGERRSVVGNSRIGCTVRSRSQRDFFRGRSRICIRTTTSSGAGDDTLLPGDQTERFTARWQQIQVNFVDQPRDLVADADTLVADLMQRLAATFSRERERLEAQWDRGDHVSTEDLRVVLTRYRSFFDRLLSA